MISLSLYLSIYLSLSLSLSIYIYIHTHILYMLMYALAHAWLQQQNGKHGGGHNAETVKTVETVKRAQMDVRNLLGWLTLGWLKISELQQHNLTYLKTAY